MTEVIFVVPFSNIEILNNWFLKSSIDFAEIIKIHLNKEKLATVELNKILESLPENKWIIFCDEWVRILNDIRPSLEGRNTNFLYGITGAKFDKKNVKLEKFDGRTGTPDFDNKEVDSIGQGCMVVHSSILKKTKIKFDEKFTDRYMVDFSLQWKSQGKKVAIISLASNYMPRIIPLNKEKFFIATLMKKYSNLLPVGSWGGIISQDLESNVESIFEQRENWIKSLVKEKMDLETSVTKLQKEFDERNTWAQSLDEQLKQKGQDLVNLQKEFDERSTWTQSLDEQLKQKNRIRIKGRKIRKNFN